MDLIEELKNVISDNSLNNISEFVGEEKDKVSSGLNLSLNTFLAGLLKYTSSDAESFKILNVLKEGGHSGDLLNNLDTLSANGEKTKMLVTIGTNISNHFFGAKSPVIDKIAEISQIKKTSASSLFSMAGPIVLGLLGREHKSNRLGVTGVRSLLTENSEDIKQSLPPAIRNLLNIKTETSENEIQNQTSEVAASVPVVEPQKARINKNTQESDLDWRTFLAWLLLALSVLGALYYWKFVKNKSENEIANPKIVTTDSSKLKSEDFLPDANKEKAIENKEGKSIKEKLNSAEIKPEVVKPAVVAKPTPIIPAPIKVAPVSKPVIVKPNVDFSKAVKHVTVARPVVYNRPEEDVEPKGKVSIPNGYHSLPSNIYARNSAEIISPSNVAAIANQLKSSSKKIIISKLSGARHQIAEDRAYALRELLIEKGVDENQIEISSSVGNDSNGVVYKISD